MRWTFLAAIALALSGCPSEPTTDAGTDGGRRDAPRTDAPEGMEDAGMEDGGPSDGGTGGRVERWRHADGE